MTLRSLLFDAPTPTHALAVVAEESNPLVAMLDASGLGETIAVDTPPVPDSTVDEETVFVLDGDGEAVASSPLSALYESFLGTNSDLFRTGGGGLGEVELPDVLASLADARFRLRGYPLAHKEKLLLILLSRFVEQRAWRAGSGTLRAGFQRTSRIDDEVGTRRVYEQLVDTDLDVHLYGIPDRPLAELEANGATVHAGDSDAYRESWFVTYRPAESTADRAAAVVAVEVGPRLWDGFFTFDRDRVESINARIRRTF